MRNFLRKLLAYGTLAVGFSPMAQGAIVANPGGFIDNGSFVTDSVSHLDWYKFSNAVSTVGLTYNQVIDSSSSFSAGGWVVATRDQVGALWGRFGYQTDSFADDHHNRGLTQAIAALLGYTYFFDFGFPSNTSIRDVIGYSASSDNSISHYQSELFWNPSGFDQPNNDYVYLSNIGASNDTAFIGAGTYLVRQTATVTNGIPEPATLALLALGIVGIGFSRYRKA